MMSLTVLNISAQKISGAKVPAAVKVSFEKKYPGINGKWEMEKGNYEVNFVQDKHNMSALIDRAGNILETEMEIAVNDLPAAALAYVSDHYKGKKITEAAKIIHADGTVNYEAEAGVDIIFDSTGKFIQEEKAEKNEKNEKD